MNIQIIFMYLLGIAVTKTLCLKNTAWTYECKHNVCQKTLIDTTTNQKNNENDTADVAAVSLSVCRLLCGTDPGTVWPKINGNVKIENILAKINRQKIEIKATNSKIHNEFWTENQKRFLEQIQRKVPKSVNLIGGDTVVININVQQLDDILTINTDEKYNIFSSQINNEVTVNINATTIFGARHGLETLSQLITFDDIRNELLMVANINIQDGPQYKHRGLLLDTSRNYFSVDSIKRTIDAMAMVKLNTFHWHITDSQSFPLVLESHPDLSKFGAYTPNKVYTAEDIADILDYAHVRGVRVLPEFDAPAHVGEGWVGKNLTACFNYQPWQSYCVEPPCGQLDPSKDELYNVLEDIYREMFELFRHPDVFHMGGDEVSTSCWNSSISIRDWMIEKQGWTKLDESDFMKLWGFFQNNALERVDKVSKEKIPIIMWTSRLTDVPYVDQYLDKARYIIQIWTTGSDSKIQDLLERGYQLILSNYDALYFDCGFGSWVSEGTNWCSPYIGWEKVYKNDLGVIAGKYRSQILGAEAALWSEQADEHVIDGRYWPRASALAERLWTDPTSSWREAESRMLIHRERLVENGIAAESLQPLWCLQNEGECPIR